MDLKFLDKRIKSVSRPCVFMLKDNPASNEITIILANPDKNMKPTMDNPLGYSLPTKTAVVLNGNYTFSGKYIPQVSSQYDAALNTTNVIFDSKDGLSTSVTLLRALND